MKPYNYFDDEEEQPQPSAQVRLAQLVAALQVNGAKLRRTVRRDEEIVEELRDYPNLRRAALKWLAVALFVLAVVIAVCRVVTGVHYISDVLAGLAFGAVFAVVGWNAFVLAASAVGFYAIMLL